MGRPPLVAVAGTGHGRSMTGTSPEIVELAAQEAIAVRGEVAMAELADVFGRAFAEAARAAAAAGVEIVGPPFGYYPEAPTDVVVVEAGFPVSARVEPDGDAHPMVLPGGRAVQALHVGPYDTMEQTYGALRSWMAAHGLHPANAMWESYLSDPEAEPDPATWRTRIVWPLVA